MKAFDMNAVYLSGAAAMRAAKCLAGMMLLIAFAQPAHAKSDAGKYRIIKLIPGIESSISMPSGAGRIFEFHRYYAWSDRHGEIYVLMIRRPAGTGIHVVDFEDLPFIRDGECGVVHAKFDTKTMKATSVRCNSGS